MAEHTYLYAFTWAGCRSLKIGPGIDARFEVEFIRQGQLAAVISRVGLDRFKAERLDAKTAADARWLNLVATRHNQVVRAVALHAPVMPLQLGTLLHNHRSLLWRMSRCEEKVVAFLSNLGDKQQWSVEEIEHREGLLLKARGSLPPEMFAIRPQETADTERTKTV